MSTVLMYKQLDYIKGSMTQDTNVFFYFSISGRPTRAEATVRVVESNLSSNLSTSALILFLGGFMYLDGLTRVRVDGSE